MRRINQFFRLIYINYIMARYGFDRVLLSARVFSPFQFLSYLNPWNWGQTSKAKTRGERVRLILEELGPIFVKFGQILSIRRDLLPEDIISELEKLQDCVPPFPGEEAEKIVEQAYGRALNAVFQSFQRTPLASASIAQVHAATLLDGRKIVIKVRRPRIEKTIRRDISLLYSVARVVEKYLPHGRRLRPRGVVAEFERTILDELDFMREAANASQLRRNFAHSHSLYIPEILWDYARVNVLMMERISGISVSNIPELKAAEINLQELAERGVEIFFTQVFRDNFFHADMHPGNIFVAKNKPDDPQYIAVDFGIVGALSPGDQRYLAENLLAFFKRDYHRVAVLHVESGWIPADARIEEFESAVRSVCEPIFEKPLREISFGQLLARLFQVAARFHMEVQPQLLLLQKTLLNIEALGRELYPDLDLWKTAKPFLERWIKQKYSMKGLMKKAWVESPFWMARLSNLPETLYEILQQHKNKYEQRISVNEMIRAEKLNKKRASQSGFLYGISFILILLFISNLTLLAPAHLIALSNWANWIVGSLAVLSFACANFIAHK